MPNHSLILYDGECAWCNGWLVRILRADVHDALRVGYVQDIDTIRSQIDPPPEVDSILLHHEGRWYVKSAAIRKALTLVDAYPALRWLLRITPRWLADIGYDLVARMRHRIAGRHDQCIIPDRALIKKHLTNPSQLIDFLGGQELPVATKTF